MILLILIHSLFALPAVNPPHQQFKWSNVSNLNYLTYFVNQHQPHHCQSSWAAAVTSMLSDKINILSNLTSQIQMLSIQQLISCNVHNEGCLSGDAYFALRWIQKNNISFASQYPYTATSFMNGNPCQKRTNKTIGIQQFGMLQGVEAIQEQIYSNGPVICQMAEINSNHYNESFVRDTGSQNVTQFVEVIGWDTFQQLQYWVVRNSYGSALGDKGFYYVIRGNNSMGIQSYCMWAKPSFPKIKQPIHQFNLRQNKQRYVFSPVRNVLKPNLCESQGIVSILSVMEALYMLKSMKKATLETPLQLSMQMLLNCGVITCNKADPLNVFNFLRQYGVTEESCQQYQGIQPQNAKCTENLVCEICVGAVKKTWVSSPLPQKCVSVSSAKYKIQSYRIISGAASMKIALLQGSIICSIFMSQSFRAYTGGIFMQVSVITKADYYVEVIGYGQQNLQEYWIGKNSWGKNWGEQGYFRMVMHRNNLLIEKKCYEMSLM